MADTKKKLTFAVSKGLAATGMVMVMSGCGPGAISNPAPPENNDCCISVNPAPDFGDPDMGPDDAGDGGVTDAGDGGTDDAGDSGTTDADSTDTDNTDADNTDAETTDTDAAD